MSSAPSSDVGNGAGILRRSSPCRTSQMSRARGPWRPTKLRLEVETGVGPGGRFSVRRHAHIEHPAHAIRAGVDKQLVEAFASHSRLTVSEPHDPGANAGRNLAAPRTAAASPQIAIGYWCMIRLKTQSTGVPAIGAPG